MKEAIIKECDGHISGQQLCDNFGVSRTAVWKVIKQLQKEGYEIEAVRNKGYHLVKSGDVMTEAEIKSCIKGTTIGRQVASSRLWHLDEYRVKTRYSSFSSFHANLGSCYGSF